MLLISSEVEKHTASLPSRLSADSEEGMGPALHFSSLNSGMVEDGGRIGSSEDLLEEEPALISLLCVHYFFFFLRALPLLK